MDGILLRVFADSIRDQLVGCRTSAFRWCKPILSMGVRAGRRRLFVVAVLRAPGPFCFVCDRDPLDGADAQELFHELSKSEISSVSVPGDDRVLVFEAKDKTGPVGGAYKLSLFLYGSFGRAELRRDGVLLHQVGSAPRRAVKRPANAPIKGWVPGGGESFYLVSRGRPASVKLATSPGSAVKHQYGPFDDVIAAVREAGLVILEEAYKRIIETRLKPAMRRVNNRNKLLENLREQLARASTHEKTRREAETLASYQSRIKPGTKKIDLPDIYDTSQTIRFELDPALPIQRQIEKRFKRAGKLQKSEAHTRRRIDEVNAELKDLSATVDAVRSAPDFASAVKESVRLERFAAAPDQAAQKHKQRDGDGAFRRFDLDRFWFVLVGRSNKDNDELTFHAASPTDLWFHAQHVPGSHVVLKCNRPSDSPPAGIIEKAASIAAYYSKAKHSSLVPVIYTRRKYVRKPRGAKPGQVVCEREKTVIVEPALPGTTP